MTSNWNEQNTVAPADWRPCDGEVNKIVRRLRLRRRGRQIRPAMLLAVFAVISVAGRFYYPEIVATMDASVAGSPCDHYMGEMREFYCDKSRSDLEPRLWEHLSTCSDCRKAMRLCGSISRASEISVTSHEHSAQTGAAGHPVSLRLFARDATLAAGR